MSDTVKDIMSSVSPLWGVCDFCTLSAMILPCRAASRIPAGAESIIVALFPYYLGESSYKDSNISRYAVVPDYNDFIKERLDLAAKQLHEKYPDESFEAFCGNSPIPEVSAAVLSGLGSKGRNGLLLTEKYGSWVFIGEIVTTLKLRSTKNAFNICDGCDKCVKACPTGALTLGGFDKAKCLSQISQQKAELSDTQKELIKKTGCAWGCDICQKACPKNIGAQTTEIDEFINGAQFKAEHGGDLSDRAYGWRGRKVIERNLDIFE